MVVLAAVGGERSPDEVITVGVDLATAYDDDLVVVHVMSREHYDALHDRQSGDGTRLSSDQAGLPGLTYESASDPDGYYVDQAEADAAGVASEVAERTLGRKGGVRSVGRVGDPTGEILDLANELEARYLVIGGRKRSPVGKAIFGSVTQSVLLSADGPVVTVMQES